MKTQAKSIAYGSLLLSTVMAGHAAAAPEAAAVKVALIGDSRVTDSAGWGKAFADRFGPDVQVRNFAMGGRSSKSWYNEKRLPPVLAMKPDYALIQFGHNDQPGKGPDRETDPATTYKDYLRLYVNELRKIGCQPILVSSVVRRTFGKDNRIDSSLTPYAEAAKEVARDLNVPFVDLHDASAAYHNRIGPEDSMSFNPKEGDRTHFNATGAEAIADLIVQNLKPVAQALCAHLKPASAKPKP
ncbi:MAG TPA: rhamnogalacturonan acetylesterase [Kiritimatiellia bacterium]|nr:rhamnogalacturonan acetylesterase [Kiritimatiellia bacterium]HPS06534.1 rhamnogalacturonan acetylesterase [Kiritimatiellia bacterium]